MNIQHYFIITLISLHSSFLIGADRQATWGKKPITEFPGVDTDVVKLAAKINALTEKCNPLKNE